MKRLIQLTAKKSELAATVAEASAEIAAIDAQLPTIEAAILDEHAHLTPGDQEFYAIDTKHVMRVRRNAQGALSINIFSVNSI